jgi:hypothetical protein
MHGDKDDGILRLASLIKTRLIISSVTSPRNPADNRLQPPASISSGSWTTQVRSIIAKPPPWRTGWM